ncbi:Envoplakin [Frankliniella fusca]|uniref:Envoplakin n=1 Tax=Frankliniella fusca TaxID=407009 RepID=A0AAE1HGP0_9NEOP|nr:Envoplakin [Frankliniella fusca]
MSAQKNTLFNYFGKSPAGKPSPSASPAPGTPKTSKVTDSPSTTPKRALGSARAGAQDSPKSSKSVLRNQLYAASPRTRVQRKLLDAAASSSSVYEPHFLRNVLSPQNKKVGQYSSPQKNKENSKKVLLSPVFKALKDHEESAQIHHPPEDFITSGESSSASEEVAISPSKCSLRRPVRNLNKEFLDSPSKILSEDPPQETKIKNCAANEGSETVDVYAAFGLYVAAEMRRLKSEQAVRLLKQKIMKLLLEAQSDLDVDS